MSHLEFTIQSHKMENKKVDTITNYDSKTEQALRGK